MKKFFIVYKDGNQQTIMPAVHNTRREALLTILNYIEDDSQIEDYMIEEIDVNKEVMNYESAIKIIGPTEFFHVRATQQNTNALIALNKLFTIAEAWNKLDDFVPNFSNWSQEKWIPWFEQASLTGKLDLRVACSFADINRSFGPKLCFKTRERAIQFGEQFVDLYNQIFLL